MTVETTAGESRGGGRGRRKEPFEPRGTLAQTGIPLRRPETRDVEPSVSSACLCPEPRGAHVHTIGSVLPRGAASSVPSPPPSLRGLGAGPAGAAGASSTSEVVQASCARARDTDSAGGGALANRLSGAGVRGASSRRISAEGGRRGGGTSRVGGRREGPAPSPAEPEERGRGRAPVEGAAWPRDSPVVTSPPVAAGPPEEAWEAGPRRADDSWQGAGAPGEGCDRGAAACRERPPWRLALVSAPRPRGSRGSPPHSGVASPLKSKRVSPQWPLDPPPDRVGAQRPNPGGGRLRTGTLPPRVDSHPFSISPLSVSCQGRGDPPDPDPTPGPPLLPHAAGQKGGLGVG